MINALQRVHENDFVTIEIFCLFDSLISFVLNNYEKNEEKNEKKNERKEKQTSNLHIDNFYSNKLS